MKINWQSFIIYLLFLLIVILLNTIYIASASSSYWLILIVWLCLAASSFYYAFITTPKPLFLKIKSLVKSDRLIILGILLLAVITRFAFLNSYPFINLGDAVRDAGINALNIKQNTNIDFFGFGSYQGYGNFIPLTSFILSFLFGISPLIYRVPAALIGIISILMTYFLGRVLKNRTVAISAALILLGSSFHLHYGRIEPVIIFDALLTPILIMSAFLAFKSESLVFIFGLIAGISLHFYAGIRVVILACFIGFILVKINKLFKDKLFKVLFRSLIILSLGFVIGLGPTLVKFNKSNLYSNVGVTSLVYKVDDNSSKHHDLMADYSRAFSTYVFTPLQEENDFHFILKSPLLTFPYNWFFLIGIGFAITNLNNLNLLLILCLSLFPLTNQVLIGSLLDNHRLIGLLPVVSVIAGLGINNVFSKFRSKFKYSRLILTLFLVILLIFQLKFYFFARPSDLAFEKHGTDDYVLESAVRHISKDAKYNNYYFYSGDQGLFLHHKEKILFLTYPKKVDLLDRGSFINYYQSNRNKIEGYLSLSSIEELKSHERYIKIDCSINKVLPNYNCPLNYSGEYGFFIYD